MYFPAFDPEGHEGLYFDVTARMYVCKVEVNSALRRTGFMRRNTSLMLSLGLQLLHLDPDLSIPDI